MDKSGLLSLPERAVEGILKGLNVWNLMSLRLVCKKTKSWVEQPDVLSRLCVTVKQRSFLKKLIQSRSNFVKWSTLMISCDTLDLSTEWIRSKAYTDVFSALSTSLRVLKFTEQRIIFNGGLDFILTTCPQIEELCVGTLNIANVRLPLPEDVLQALATLKTLSVTYIAWEEEKDLQFIPQVLCKCTSLKSFKLPYVLAARLYCLYPSLGEDEVDAKLETITENLVFTSVEILFKNQVQAHGKSLLKYLDVENFELEQLLGKVALVCQQYGCLLVNVLEAFERPFTKEESLLCGCIGSLLSCTKNLDLNRLENVQSVNILEDYTSSSDVDKNFEKATLPALTSVTLTLTISILVSERLASCFLQQRRPSVKFVTVKFSELKGSAQASVFRSPKFASSFPCLRSLSLDGFDGKSESYLLFWKNFPLLEKLELQNCRTLNDNALIGPDVKNPAILGLTHLRKLSLESEEVTDETIQLAVSKLQLEELFLYLSKVTFSGLSFLLNGDTKKSLAVLHCMKPDDCSDHNMKLFFQGFENIKKHEILF